MRSIIVAGVTGALLFGLLPHRPQETPTALVTDGADVEPDARASIAKAVAAAVGSAEPVAIEELTTPYERTVALPDGTHQYEASNTPVRVEADGIWVPVGTGLERHG